MVNIYQAERRQAVPRLPNDPGITNVSCVTALQLEALHM